MAWTIGTAEDQAPSSPARPLLRRPFFVLGLAGILAALVAGLSGVAGAGWALLAWIGALLVAAGVRGLLAARPPKDGPSFAIARLRPGPVEVVGRVVPPRRALLSPLTSTKCSFYDYRIRVLDEPTGERRLVDQGSRRSDFWLKDITGSVFVESEGLEISIGKQLDEDLRTYDQTPRAVGERLHKLKVDPFLEPGVRRPIFIEETRLDPGDNVLLSGEAVRGEDGAVVVRAGAGPFRVERWSRPTFIAVPEPGSRLRVGLGAACVLAAAAGMLL